MNRLGLSIVNKIINDHNGKIEFIKINDGAKVQIRFDLNDSEILIVDDNSDIRKILIK